MNRKKNWVIIAVVIFLFLFPFVLNWILQRKAVVSVVGDSTVWLSFWPVYLSAVASFGMIYFTFLSLKQSKEQLEDFKNREEEAHRARLVISVVVYQAAFYLKISNIGKENAYNVQLSVNEDFINEIEERFRIYFRKLSQPDFIEANKSIFVLIGWCQDVNKAWDGKNIVLTIDGTYNDKYLVRESLDMTYFLDKSHFVVKGDLETTMEYMKKGLVVQNNEYMPMQKSLHTIAKTLEKVESSIRLIEDYLENNNDKV